MIWRNHLLLQKIIELMIDEQVYWNIHCIINIEMLIVSTEKGRSL